MATLTYTSEQRGFSYTDGAYVLSGTKNSKMNGEIQSVDGGNVMKDGLYIGYFNVRYEGEQIKISITEAPFEEMTTIQSMLSALLVELVGQSSEV